MRGWTCCQRTEVFRLRSERRGEEVGVASMWGDGLGVWALCGDQLEQGREDRACQDRQGTWVSEAPLLPYKERQNLRRWRRGPQARLALEGGWRLQPGLQAVSRSRSPSSSELAMLSQTPWPLTLLWSTGSTFWKTVYAFWYLAKIHSRNCVILLLIFHCCALIL